jgi:ubiquinone/menaquinone biosynthesis C-methylase UbiE
MLREGRDRLTNAGLLLPSLLCDAEKLPFPDNHFDCVTVAFGLRNMTHKDRALAEFRVLLPAAARWCWSFPCRQAAGKGLRRVFVQGAALAGQTRRERRSKLPLSRRVDPHASGPGHPRGHDARRGA